MIVFNYNSIDRWWVEWQNYGGGHFRLNLWYHVQIFFIMADLFTSQIITKRSIYLHDLYYWTPPLPLRWFEKIMYIFNSSYLWTHMDWTNFFCVIRRYTNRKIKDTNTIKNIFYSDVIYRNNFLIVINKNKLYILINYIIFRFRLKELVSI